MTACSIIVELGAGWLSVLQPRRLCCISCGVGLTSLGIPWKMTCHIGLSTMPRKRKVPRSALKRTVRSGEQGKRSDSLRLGKPCLLPLPATCLFLTKSDMGGSQKRNPVKHEPMRRCSLFPVDRAKPIRTAKAASHTRILPCV